MGWLSKLQRRNKGRRHETASTTSTSTANTILSEKNMIDSKGEEMLRKIIRNIMIEEAGKIDKQDHLAGLIKEEALIVKQEEKREAPPEEAPPIPKDHSETTAPAEDASPRRTPPSEQALPIPKDHSELSASAEQAPPNPKKVVRAASAPLERSPPPNPKAFVRASSSGTSQQGHQRSIRDVLAGILPDDVSAMGDSITSFIHPENITNKQFDATVKNAFPGALDNYSFIKQLSSMLVEKNGCVKSNTLLATSFCCDEASRQLEDDLEGTYGRNFNLGGLAGFPWAGQTGFAAMAHHIPEGGNCLLVYGPHVGITKEGLVGKVERGGIAKPDTCCGSAVAASNYARDITDGRAMISTNLNSFTDFQQGAIQQMILPHCKRLDEAKDRMLELPYALYESQDLLMTTIAESGASATPNGVILLGGIQINTGPTTADYFHPLRFSYMNKDGKIVDDWLDEFCERSGSKLEADGRVQRARTSVFAMGGISPMGRHISEQKKTEMAEAVSDEESGNKSQDPDGDICESYTSEWSEDNEVAELEVASPTKCRMMCAQEPGGDHVRSKSICTKSVDMSGHIATIGNCNSSDGF